MNKISKSCLLLNRLVTTLVFVISAFLLFGCNSLPAVSDFFATVTPTATITYTPTITATSTPTVTPTRTPRPTATVTPTAIPPLTLRIRAYVDGTSQIIIHDNSLEWYQLGADAPGRNPPAYEPTYINGQVWYPIWPDKPNQRNRDCYCKSSTYDEIPALAQINQIVSIDKIQARGSVRIIQQPQADNNYTLIIELDDGPPGGAYWYEISIGYLTS